jgi:hypothetical protein
MNACRINKNAHTPNKTHIISSHTVGVDPPEQNVLLVGEVSGLGLEQNLRLHGGAVDAVGERGGSGVCKQASRRMKDAMY